MIRFVSIKVFRQAIEALLKVKRGVYSAAPSEICKAFQNIPIEQIRANRDMILMEDDAIAIKLRLPDKKQNLSKADGFRLIYVVMKEVPVVGLLTIYPKRGPMQKIDLENGELRKLVNDFKQELAAKQVMIHDINDNLKVINLDQQ